MPLHPRGSSGQAGRPSGGGTSWAVVALALLATAAAGCSPTHAGPHSPASSATRTHVTYCGTTRTAANVPVKLEVASGDIPCNTAKAVERAYAKAIRSGLAPGNGGGGPVQIKGWTCQGFATPIVLDTGKASKCTRDGIEILEILPPPASPSSS